MSKNKNCNREYDFALIIGGVPELTEEVENALFEAGCDDATFGIRYGYLYADFSREAASIKEAILSAILDILKADIGADILRVDECNLVTPSEIARKTNRSRQMIHQYITGERGPGNFPPPVCHLAEGKPLWSWCNVSCWLAENNLIREEEFQNMEVIYAINVYLESEQQQKRSPTLVKEIEKTLSDAHA